MCPVCVGRKKIFGVKATGSNSFHRCGGPPPSSREGDRPQAVEGVRRRWKEFVPHALKGVRARRPLEKTFFKLHMLHMHHMPDTH